MSPPVATSVFTGSGRRGLGKKETDPVVDVAALHAWCMASACWRWTASSNAMPGRPARRRAGFSG